MILAKNRKLTQALSKCRRKICDRGVIERAGHMTYDRFLKAALVGLALSVAPAANLAQAETLRVVRGATDAALSVPMNRAVVCWGATGWTANACN